MVGLPFCVLVTGTSGPPTVVARGGGGVSITPQGAGYLICVTPTGLRPTLQLRLESGSTVRSVSVVVVPGP